MRTDAHVYLGEIMQLEMFETNVVEKIKTHFYIQ